MSSSNLPTFIPGVELRPLVSSDAAAFFALVQRNRAFLTRYGDYTDLVSSTEAEIAAGFSNLAEGSLAMGIWRGAELLGRADLNSIKAGVYVLGYWLGEEYSGQGIMTAACRALIETAVQTCGAAEIWAGVRHANQASIRLLERLGFSVYDELPDRKRYRLVEPGPGETSW